MKKLVVQLLLSMFSFLLYDIYTGKFNLLLISSVFFISLFSYTLLMDYLDKNVSDFKSFWYVSYSYDTSSLLGVVIVSSIMRFFGFHNSLLLAAILFIFFHLCVEFYFIMQSQETNKIKRVLRVLLISLITIVVIY